MCPLSGHIGAIWRIRLKLFFLRPTLIYNSNGKSIGSAVSAQLTAESPYTLQWATLSPKIAPSHGGIWTPDSWFFGPVRAHNLNGISIGSAVFAQVTAECSYALQLAPLSPKLPFPRGDLDPELIHGNGSLAHPIPQAKWHFDRFSRFCMAH